MRISDWSSDVCSSDLPATTAIARAAQPRLPRARLLRRFLHGGQQGRQTLRGPRPDSRAHRREVRDRQVSADGSGTRRRLIRSEEHTSELQSLMRISYAVFCLKKQKNDKNTTQHTTSH